jgi:hypothetical protein
MTHLGLPANVFEQREDGMRTGARHHAVRITLEGRPMERTQLVGSDVRGEKGQLQLHCCCGMLHETKYIGAK